MFSFELPKLLILLKIFKHVFSEFFFLKKAFMRSTSFAFSSEEYSNLFTICFVHITRINTSSWKISGTPWLLHYGSIARFEKSGIVNNSQCRNFLAFCYLLEISLYIFNFYDCMFSFSPMLHPSLIFVASYNLSSG
ncbi:hypothetical protein kam1_840 [Methylacidiphilum kamchatkense Kam1]|uniref:Uncharacterized protein n=1 Tax=Methylacidiphilum kamchatkense Kam1 TaxID=1202785 RepID=A0A516TLG7_9BACT|nr:hypothetical protein kam1_840 [Methylacidiphilum kamchatkense Kam1]